MKQRKVLLGLVLTIAIFFVLGTSIAIAAETIKVGIVLPLTGKLANFGEIENKSFLMALEEINGGGGINGKK
ncbi:MAG: transporter substrate-binding protein [Deltaproteobacteria bacterium]|nr:transporter substrate-binding protein [Deltaproteobacteria bacterium]